MFTAMTPSSWLWSFLQQAGNEGPLRTSAYQDGGGVWTIGYGHTRGVTEGMTCTSDQAAQWLQNDVAAAVVCVLHMVDVAISQAQFDALVSFVFNVGAGNFASSTLLRKLNAKDYTGAADEFLKWNHVDGVVEGGLTTRREAERAHFITGFAL
jgi:lysozyme